MMFRYFFFFLLIWATSSIVWAQNKDFIHISIHDYSLENGVPVYREHLNISETTATIFDVQVIYPEYVALNKAEKKQLRHFLQNHAAEKDFRLQQHLAFSQKVPQLNVSLCPIVKVDGHWKRLSSCKLELRPRTSTPRKAAILSAERWQPNSVLAQGKWVKIRVAEEGIYTLTPQFLQQVGFTDPTRVKVYGYGGLLQDETFDFTSNDITQLITAAPDDLNEVATLRHNGKILFWAEGTRKWHYQANRQAWHHQNNHYSTHSYYFLTEGEAPLQVQTLASTTLTPTTRTASVPYAIALDDDHTAWYEGGRRLFDAYNFNEGHTHNYKLHIPAVAPNTTALADIAFSASSTLSHTDVHISHNGKHLGKLYIGVVNTILESARAAKSTFSLTTIPEGENTFTFTTANNHNARLDYIRVNYQRLLKLENRPYSFSPRGGTDIVQLDIANTNATTQVWRIAQRGNPTVALDLQQAGTQQAHVITDTPNRRFVIFDMARDYPSPEFVGTVTPQNLHADKNIDLVILIAQNSPLEAQAQRLAELHRQKDGLRTKVVKAGDLYNEFSSGTPDANAYRRYLKMLYDRAQTAADAPKYLIFLGRSPWDGRLLSQHWKGQQHDQYLLAYEVDNSEYSIGTVHSFTTDDFFCMLDDNEGKNIVREHMDLAVGRMVCNTAQEAQRLIDKIETYLSNQDAGIWKNKICMLADDGDANEHGNDAEQVSKTISTQTQEKFDLKKIYWDSYQRQSGATGFTYPIVSDLIKKQMKEGALVFNYSGHGAPHQISHEKTLVLSDFQKTYSPTMSLWVVASCEIFPHDGTDENLAEHFLFQEQGGAIAFMCASRAVYAIQNNALNRAFMKHVLSKTANGQALPMGEALRLAKRDLVNSGSDLTINKHKYLLLGDPALPLALPQREIILDSINGKPIETTRQQLRAGQVVHFSGFIAQNNESRQTDSDFQGTITAELFDRSEILQCKDNDGSCRLAGVAPLNFETRSRNLHKGVHRVSNGRFSFTMVIPRDISYTNDAARLSLYALSEDKQIEAHGQSQAFYLNGTDANALQDSIAPQITAYINEAATQEKAIISGSPTLIVDIRDDSGISLQSLTPGHDLELIIDGKTADAITLNDYFTYDFGSYQKGQIIYPLPPLDAGLHTLEIRVWDVNNNLASTKLSFYLSNTPLRETELVLSKNPASTHTTLIAQFPTTNGQNHITFEAYNNAGVRVWTKTVSSEAGVGHVTLLWSLTDNNGLALPEGIYHLRFQQHHSTTHTQSRAKKLIIKR